MFLFQGINGSHQLLGDISDLEFCRAWNLDLYENPNLTGLEVISTMKREMFLFQGINGSHQLRTIVNLFFCLRF